MNRFSMIVGKREYRGEKIKKRKVGNLLWSVICVRYVVELFVVKVNDGSNFDFNL